MILLISRLTIYNIHLHKKRNCFLWILHFFKIYNLLFQIFIDRFLYVLSSPKAGDVVAFLPNGNENSHYYIKRVVAGPGDKVRIADGTLYVNGQQSIWVTERVLDAGIAENELILGSGEYFCIGDNPNNSEDSRSANIGPVDEDDIVGKAWFHLKSSTEGMGFIK